MAPRASVADWPEVHSESFSVFRPALAGSASPSLFAPWLGHVSVPPASLLQVFIVCRMEDERICQFLSVPYEGVKLSAMLICRIYISLFLNCNNICVS